MDHLSDVCEDGERVLVELRTRETERQRDLDQLCRAAGNAGGQRHVQLEASALTERFRFVHRVRIETAADLLRIVEARERAT